jgi:tetratricopeptide (TPR) repeat protein
MSASAEPSQGEKIVLAQLDNKIVFRDEHGRELSLSDLDEATGNVEWELVGAGYVPDEAQELHQLGRAAGANGDFRKALPLLEQAHRVAPDWPFPVYDTAFTYLLMGEFDKALQFYERTDELSPRGFFTVKTAAHTLRRETAGDLPTGTYLSYLQLEWIDGPGEKCRAVSKLVEAVPDFAAAWKEYASTCCEKNDDDCRLDAIEKGLAADPDEETKGFLIINKAIVLHGRGKKDRAVEILGRLALDLQATLGVVESAKAALALLLRQDSKR